MPNRLVQLFRRRKETPDETVTLLQQAHAQMEAGDYAVSANSFEKLAQRAEKRNGPRAPFFYIQAGRAFLLSKDKSSAMVPLKKGLTMLAQAKNYRRLAKIGMSIVEDLKLHGNMKEAREINNLVISNMPAMADLPTEHGPDPARIVPPVTCTSCGGPVRSDEVEWIDAHSAECPYCGVPLRMA